MATDGKPHVSIIVCGDPSTGKSTTTGRLLYELGMIPENEMQKLQGEAAAMGMSSKAFAFYLDRQKEERALARTVFCNTTEMSTEKFHYTIIDAPGYEEYIKNTISGVSQADVGLLVMRAPGFRDDQGMNHARLLSAMGVKQLIVGVNMMDADPVLYSEKQYTEMFSCIKFALSHAGWNSYVVANKVPILPMSGYLGENLSKKSDKMPWWSGVDVVARDGSTVRVTTLLDALNNFVKVPERKIAAPLRLPISAIYNVAGVGDVLAGRVDQGIVKLGDEVIFLPTHTATKPCEGKVATMEMRRTRVDQASCGDHVGITITGLDKGNMPRAGDVMILKSDDTLKQVKDFTAQIKAFKIPKEVNVGYSPIGLVACGRSACRITSINWKVVGGKKEDKPTYLLAIEMATAEVVFEPSKPLIMDTVNNSDSLSRIVFLEGDKIIMIGRVVNITPK